MNSIYQHIETVKRNYQGIGFDEHECRGHLQGYVKDNLVDRGKR